MKFSLIIPCYNEAANLPGLLDRCKVLGSRAGAEIILVDNGSSDNSSDLLEKLLPLYPGCRSIRVEKNQGYGFGILSGLRAARGDIIGWTHADMQTDPHDVASGLDFFEQYGSDIFVKGRRYGRPITDMIFTIGMSLFESVLFGKLFWDINAQPTLFSKDFFLTWEDPPHDFSLDLYAYYQAHCQRLTFHRFPVKFGERAHGLSRWNVSWAAKRRFIHRTMAFSLQLKKRLKS